MKITRTYIQEACGKLTQEQFAARFTRGQLTEMYCEIVGYYPPAIISTDYIVKEIYRNI